MTPALGPGTKLGRYEIHSQLGSGGMGEVYLARDTELERMVAVKVLSVEAASDQERMNRFIQEAKAASALNHPNIITIYEVSRETPSALSQRSSSKTDASPSACQERPSAQLRF